jgi:hypothetical protein
MTWYDLQKFLKYFFRSFFPLSVAIFFFKKGFSLQSGLRYWLLLELFVIARSGVMKQSQKYLIICVHSLYHSATISTVENKMIA